MRKAILEIEPYDAVKEAQKWMFTHIHSYEVLEVLKMDHVKGMFIDLIECHLRDGVEIADLKSIGNMEILSVIRSDGNKHTCLVKGTEPKKARDDFDENQMDLIYTTPSLISQDKIIVSFICAQNHLVRFSELVAEHIGTIKNLTVKPAMYQKKDILTLLTPKQREVMSAAYRHGYYDIPRKIDSGELASKVNISKPTLLEHLRKAERRIIVEIMAGNSEERE